MQFSHIQKNYYSCGPIIVHFYDDLFNEYDFPGKILNHFRYNFQFYSLSLDFPSQVMFLEQTIYSGYSR